MLYKLNWIFTQSEETWAQLLHAKFHTTSDERIQYHKRSSVWSGIKHTDDITKPSTEWIIGKGTKIDLWRDSWASNIPLREHIDLPRHLWKKCTARVSDFINVDGWNFPADISLAFLAMGIDINNIPCNPSVEDIQTWKPDVHCDFSVKNAFECTRKCLDIAWWWRYTWRKCLHPSLSGLAWRLMNQILPTDEKVQRKGIPITSVCVHCGSNAETEDHIFFECPTTKVMWVWVTNAFQLAAISGMDGWKNTLEKCRMHSSYLNDLWITMVFAIC
ncbi:hypothetical protein GIB67_025299 [Kingdonia uniflora]|uniref:Reverse transcriptase zinc-binding domain-containing protein n=1 Tax=Kingdonia uniflora TaxID=39325 RepID=A0A7J7NBJ4_9MAGN|nr:hypothetical protein GIB67_025299 [Kingdonia uniflora]